jgi:serine/threonine protein kinase
MIGQKIAHYEVTEKIGAGCMGEVFRARDTKLSRDVALKVLPETFAVDAERLSRFDRRLCWQTAPPSRASSSALRFISPERATGKSRTTDDSSIKELCKRFLDC